MTEMQVQDQRIELKYLLDASLSLEVRGWAREHLGVDAHCNESLGDSYEVNTLYLDTPELDLFHRTREVGKAKHRIRRYGDEPTWWLETKRKRSNVVKKNRTATNGDEVVARLSNLADQAPWCGEWFASRILERRLQPTVQIHYRRFARTSTLDGESLRLTIDSHLQTSPAHGWHVAATSDSVNRCLRMHATDTEVLELKFHNRMPYLFKELLRSFAIPATSFSKYRTAVACAVHSPPVANGHSQAETASLAMSEESANA